MSAFTLIAALVSVLPCEYHIDCSGWDGAATVEFGVRVTATDGTAYKTKVQLFPDSAAENARNLIWFGLEENKWRGRTVGKGVLILTGSRDAGVRSVEFTGDGWKPLVRWVPLLPEQKK